jgi:hypothetical protein
VSKTETELAWARDKMENGCRLVMRVRPRVSC